MSDGELARCVQDVLHEVRPNLQMDGNDAYLASCQDGVVSIRLEGAGTQSHITYRGLEETVREKIREYLPAIQHIITYTSDGL